MSSLHEKQLKRARDRSGGGEVQKARGEGEHGTGSATIGLEGIGDALWLEGSKEEEGKSQQGSGNIV